MIGDKSVKDYRSWIVWQKSMDFVSDIYEITKDFPVYEIYGLTSQLRRAAVSIPSNIAEGYRRVSKNERIHFCKIAFGSAGELETQLEIARRIKYLSENDFNKLNQLLLEILKLLSAFIFKK